MPLSSPRLSTAVGGMVNPDDKLKPDRIATGLLMSNVLRSSELYHPKEQRIIEDEFGRRFLPPLWRAFLLPGLRHLLLALVEGRLRGGVGMLICRTRYIDDALRAALDQGCTQVVNMGVGFDTRSFRASGIERTKVFELDQSAPIAWKAARVAKMFGTTPAHVTFVPIDFDQHDTGEALERAGFRRGARTFFIWEGVTQYISSQAVDDTLCFVGQAGGPGSQIAFTYIKKGVIDGTARSASDEKIVALARRGGAPWVFGFTPETLEAYLAERSLTLVEDIGADAYKARYLDPIGRIMDIYDGECVALARVSG